MEYQCCFGTVGVNYVDIRAGSKTVSREASTDNVLLANNVVDLISRCHEARGSMSLFVMIAIELI